MLHLIRIVLPVLLMIMLISPCTAAPSDGYEFTTGYMTVVDEKGLIILQTGMNVHPGDEFIDENNRAYEITTVEGTLAKARFVRDETYSQTLPEAIPVQAQPAEPAPSNQPPPVEPKPTIGIYNTHTDESYIPSDGNPTDKGKGGVILVAEAFAKRLNENGYNAVQDKTLHEPHDANAYQRSRRTVTRILQDDRPIALFDVHRDSAPAQAYDVTIQDQPATKILLVVGKENQNRSTTLDYAKSIKSAADTKYRGLIRGIFLAHGNYNQDLNPRAMLIEIGTQYNSREAAERSAALFADVVPSFLGTTGNVAQAAPAQPNQINAGSYVTTAASSGQDIMFILGALAVGTGAFLFLSTGSWQEARAKLNQFRRREFGDIFLSRKKRKD